MGLNEGYNLWDGVLEKRNGWLKGIDNSCRLASRSRLPLRISEGCRSRNAGYIGLVRESGEVA